MTNTTPKPWRRLAALTPLLGLLLMVTGIGSQAAGSHASPIPTDSTALLAWLQTGEYRQWQGLEHTHKTRGAHFGWVQAWVNPALAQSLGNDRTPHPVGATAVLELYGQKPGELMGWAVASKKTSATDDGNNWHWFEFFSKNVYSNGAGIPICVDCHKKGRDFILH